MHNPSPDCSLVGEISQNYCRQWYPGVHGRSVPGFVVFMMTSSYGNIFRVIGPFWGEFNGHRWIPLTKTSDEDAFFDLRLNKRLSKQSIRLWFKTPLPSLWRHVCNVSATRRFQQGIVLKAIVMKIICCSQSEASWTKNFFLLNQYRF